jgi:shikimate kinase
MKYSDKIVDCSNKDIEQCVSEIIEKIQESHCGNSNNGY